MKKEEKQALSIAWKYNKKTKVNEIKCFLFTPDMENQIPLKEMTRKEMADCYNILVTMEKGILKRIESTAAAIVKIGGVE